jgi:hypothetical protein
LSYFHPGKNVWDTSGTISFSVMADQTFKNDWYVSVSALYNSNPSNITGYAENVFSSGLSAKALFPYLYTFFIGILKTFTPVLSLNFSLIYSPEKNALILFPSYAWNVAKNFDFDFTAQSFFATVNHQYKVQGNSIFIRGKWSF